MEEKKPRRPPGAQVYPTTRGLWVRPYNGARKEAMRIVRERVRSMRGGREGCAHLHAEPQSDCGAHRQLTRFVPSFLKRRHWDSAWKVKTDFSRSPAAPMATRATNFSSTFTPFLPGLQVPAFPTTLSFSLPPHCFLFPTGVSRPSFQTTRCFHLQHRLPSLYYTL